MPIAAPIRVTVEIRLRSGDAAGQRRFRLSSRVALPPRVELEGPLPIDGEGLGRVRFPLPALDEPDRPATWIESDARLTFDPEHPEHGAAAALLGLAVADQQHLEHYIQERVQP